LEKAVQLTAQKDKRQPLPDFVGRFKSVGRLEGLWVPSATATRMQNSGLQVLDAWRPYVLDAVTAHIKGIGQALVDVPVLDAMPEGLQYSLNDLICTLVRAVHAQVSEWEPPADRWKLDVRRHKANVPEVEGLVFWHKACCTDRPAFSVLECTDAATGLWEERLHWYIGMGGDQQHTHIQTTLARVRNSPCILTAVLALIPRLLPTVRLYKELMLIEVPEGQRRGGTPAQVQRALDLQLRSSCTELHSEPGTLSLLLDMIHGGEPYSGLPENLSSVYNQHHACILRRLGVQPAAPGPWAPVDPSRLPTTPR